MHEIPYLHRNPIRHFGGSPVTGLGKVHDPLRPETVGDPQRYDMVVVAPQHEHGNLGGEPPHSRLPLPEGRRISRPVKTESHVLPLRREDRVHPPNSLWREAARVVTDDTRE